MKKIMIAILLLVLGQMLFAANGADKLWNQVVAKIDNPEKVYFQKLVIEAYDCKDEENPTKQSEIEFSYTNENGDIITEFEKGDMMGKALDEDDEMVKAYFNISPFETGSEIIASSLEEQATIERLDSVKYNGIKCARYKVVSVNKEDDEETKITTEYWVDSSKAIPLKSESIIDINQQHVDSIIVNQEYQLFNNKHIVQKKKTTITKGSYYGMKFSQKLVENYDNYTIK